jgi:hypothetical protein
MGRKLGERGKVLSKICAVEEGSDGVLVASKRIIVALARAALEHTRINRRNDGQKRKVEQRRGWLGERGIA